MKRDRLLQHAGVCLGLALVLYAAGYAAIEHARSRKGPWQVRFDLAPQGTARVRLDQPRLGITNVTVLFTNRTAVPPVASAPVEFATPQSTPFDVPFGRCVFMDPTFLPGTVVLDLFGHQIQMIPRTLMIDGREVGWRSDAVHELGLSPDTGQDRPAVPAP